jgi:hypothetical protein
MEKKRSNKQSPINLLRNASDLVNVLRFFITLIDILKNNNLL